MFLWPVLACAFLVILARGGRIGNIAAVQFRHAWLAAVGVTGSHFAYASELLADRPFLGRPLWIISIVALGTCMWLNRRYAGLGVTTLGAGCNALVIAVNGGRMPTGRWGYELFGRMPDWYRQPNIPTNSPELVLPFTGPNTRLDLLADVLPPVLPLSYPFSIGDVLLGIGVIWFLADVMLPAPSIGIDAAVANVEADALTGTTRPAWDGPVADAASRAERLRSKMVSPGRIVDCAAEVPHGIIDRDAALAA